MTQFFAVIEHITLNDCIDILIVSLIIYNILVIIKGTRAVQMLLGLGAVAFLYAVSSRYSFYSVSWILDQFFDSFFVIAIILFQDQIRSALVTFGNTKLFGKKKQLRLDQAIEEVVEACGALKREKTGAIIVFERQNGLLNYAQTGTKLQSYIHSDIIYSIFQTISPLHDGAIILSQDRILSAGCFLPLSKNVEIDRHLGTRHRAALGISEVTDAVIVTVSEETGKVNVCFNGIFYHMSNDKALRKQLRRLLTDESKPALLNLQETEEG